MCLKDQKIHLFCIIYILTLKWNQRLGCGYDLS